MMQNDRGELQRRLRELADKTHGPLVLDRRVYGRGKGETRRFVLDRRAGRHSFALAYENAVTGLAVLDRGETEKAATFLWAAERCYISALEAVVETEHFRAGAKASGRKKMPAPAKKPVGRPSRQDRDLRIAAVVEAARRKWGPSQANAAAKRDNPDLFRGLGKSGINEAVRRAKKRHENPL